MYCIVGNMVETAPQLAVRCWTVWPLVTADPATYCQHTILIQGRASYYYDTGADLMLG